MSLENIASGLFNFDPTASLQRGTSMGAQMMEIALRDQSMMFDAAAKMDQANAEADRNNISRRSQMFNEMTKNLNRFDEQAKQNKAEAWATGGGSGVGGGNSSPNYAQSSPAPNSSPSMDPGRTYDLVDSPTLPGGGGFNTEGTTAPPMAPSNEQSITTNIGPVVTPIGGGSQPVEAPGGKPFRMSGQTPVQNQFVTAPDASMSGSAPMPTQQSQSMADRGQSPVSFANARPQTPVVGQLQNQFTFKVDRRTRDQMQGQSTAGSRTISLDYNSSNSGGNYAMIVIPNDASAQERSMANQYVNDVTGWFRQNGVTVGDPVVKTTAENGRGVGGFFHTEPAFVENRQAMGLLQEKAPEYAQILAKTLGTIPGATFIPPHQSNDPGASGNGFLPEREFAKQFLIPNLEAISRNRNGGDAVAGNLSAYSPQRGASNVSGSRGEGGYAAARPGPDGVAEVRTLADFADGRSPYVTVAGNPQLIGRQYTIPSISYEDSTGNVRTLEDVPAYVHDTGSAFGNAPEGRFDIPIARDQSNDLMAKNHSRWREEGVTLLPQPMTGERQPPQPIGTAQSGPVEMVDMGGGAQAQGAGGQAIDYSQFREYRAAQEARTSYQQNLQEKIQGVGALSGLRNKAMEIDQEIIAKDAEAYRLGLKSTDPWYKTAINPLKSQRVRVENEIQTEQARIAQIQEREKVLQKSVIDSDATWKITRENQEAYTRTTPGAQPVIDKETMIDAYMDAPVRERIKMKTRFAEDAGLLRSFDMADEEMRRGQEETWRVGGDDYTLQELARYYIEGDPLMMDSVDGVKKLVDSNPKLKERVMAIRVQSQTAPAAVADPTTAPAPTPIAPVPGTTSPAPTPANPRSSEAASLL